jgi:hypothetical protein
MPGFRVEMTKIPTLRIGYSDVIFHVEQNEENIGSLRISKGHIVWTPANKQYSYWLDWNKFGDIMVNNGDARKAKY